MQLLHIQFVMAVIGSDVLTIFGTVKLTIFGG